MDQKIRYTILEERGWWFCLFMGDGGLVLLDSSSKIKPLVVPDQDYLNSWMCEDGRLDSIRRESWMMLIPRFFMWRPNEFVYIIL